MNTEQQTGFVVWHRQGRRFKWKRVAEAPTETEANVLIGAGGHRHGHWLVRPEGKSPNDDGKCPTTDPGRVS